MWSTLPVLEPTRRLRIDNYALSIVIYSFISSDFILDRGPAEYFHGRKEIIDTFASALEVLRKKKKGTTFLIH
ncbi:MAG: hypothetical protein OXE59_00695 [Bacteroidetes bacterium]|nr:hypothetical protein [Bacteroidota bacterium]